MRHLEDLGAKLEGLQPEDDDPDSDWLLMVPDGLEASRIVCRIRKILSFDFIPITLSALKPV